MEKNIVNKNAYMAIFSSMSLMREFLWTLQI